MNFRTLIFTLIILICSCSGNKTVKLYQLQKDLAYDPEGGDGVGIVTDIKSITKSTLLKGTKISVTSQDVESAVSGTERVVEVKIQGNWVHPSLIGEVPRLMGGVLGNLGKQLSSDLISLLFAFLTLGPGLCLLLMLL